MCCRFPHVKEPTATEKRCPGKKFEELFPSTSGTNEDFCVYQVPSYCIDISKAIIRQNAHIIIMIRGTSSDTTMFQDCCVMLLSFSPGFRMTVGRRLGRVVEALDSGSTGCGFESWFGRQSTVSLSLLRHRVVGSVYNYSPKDETHKPPRVCYRFPHVKEPTAREKKHRCPGKILQTFPSTSGNNNNNNNNEEL